MLSYSDTPVIALHDALYQETGLSVSIKREDQNHPLVSGNKWWKLKYNLEAFRQSGKMYLLTFGGAYSNHIYAAAAACREEGIPCIGVIRGDEDVQLNATLKFASDAGMILHRVTREAYRKKDRPEFLQDLQRKFGEYFLVPEGGTNEHAIRGVRELGQELNKLDFDLLVLPVGTGGTIAGLIDSILPDRKIIGIPALKKGEFLINDIRKWTSKTLPMWSLETEYHFGGYAKFPEELKRFVHRFEDIHDIILDPVYTGKMMAGLNDLIVRGRIDEGSKILALHTGGLQGWTGFDHP